MTDDIPSAEDHKQAAQLTDEYRKAQKSYILASGLLAAWELIGITLDTKEKWGVELKSPAGLPVILFALVLYSGYKMEIEWLQCESGSRKHRAAKLDFVVTHGIALTAITIAILQYLYRIQLVEVVGGWVWKDRFELLFVCTMSLMGLLLTFGTTIVELKFDSRRERISLSVIFFWLMVMLGASIYFGAKIWMRGAFHFIPSFLLGICALVLFLWIIQKVVDIIRAALFL